MHFKYSVLAASLAAAITLSGCGGSDNTGSGSDNNGSGNNNLQTNTIKVIDGYLSQAEVCVDRNENSVCDASELLDTVTNTSGEITISDADTKFPLIARAIAGKTTDSDKAGTLGNSYELIAKAGSKVVTPFTTMASVQDMTLDELAAELNLPSEVISGDYVIMKASDKKAKEAHLLARSVTNKLAPSVKNNDAQELTKTTETLRKAIADSINAGDNLDSIVIEIDESGQANSIDIITSLDAYLKDNTLFMASLNNAYAAEEGIAQISFKDGMLSFKNDKNDIFSTPYSVENNTLKHIEEGETSEEEFVYISQSTSLSVTPQGDLNFWTTVDLNKDYKALDMVTASFVDQTWHYLDDDSTNKKAHPMLASMTFHKDGTATVSEAGEADFTLNWEVKETTDSEFGTIQTLSLSANEFNDMNLMLVTKDNSIMTVNNLAREKAAFSLLVKDKAMADSIMAKWGKEL
ncbi:hypothetical protein MD588_11775 [Photobacterium sp. SDRW27]|uniref:hypothetical protein n=1 Tax=Photobacterium obscurum TaxID=2829490 RepID=UPI0022447192|nr:hypothetical protein [Photobacterium obscurum]MCW8329483.1 hypothetical protein [Photobacterium obscurum]